MAPEFVRYHELSDAELVMLTLAKNEDAYSVLVDRWQRAVITAAHAVTGDRYAAEDAAQESFLQGWFKLHTLSDPEKFGAWVCRIARNRALNTVTRQPRFLPIDTLHRVPSESASPEKLVVRRESRDRIAEAFRKLPPQSRRAAVLYYLQHIPQTQIAAMLGITSGTLKKRMFDARKILKKELAEVFIELENRRADNGKDERHMKNTFTEKVMKKLDELKNYYVNNCYSYDGFDKTFADTEKLVAKMEPSPEKEIAEAQLCIAKFTLDSSDDQKEKAWQAAEKINDVAQLGNWMIDKMVALDGEEKWIAFLNDEALPYFEKRDAKNEIGRLSFWGGVAYFRLKRFDEAETYFSKAVELADCLATRANAYSSLDLIGLRRAAFASETQLELEIHSCCICMGYHNNRLILRGQPGYSVSGNGYSPNFTSWTQVLYGAQGPDRTYLVDGMQAGDVICSAHGEGTTLTCVSTDDTIATVSGTYEHCTVTVVEEDMTKKTMWYCPNIGLVRFKVETSRETCLFDLASCEIVGGKGLMPLAIGNKWRYINPALGEGWHQTLDYTVFCYDSDCAFIGSTVYITADKKMLNNDIEYLYYKAKKKSRNDFEGAIHELKTIAIRGTHYTDPYIAAAAIRYLEKQIVYRSRQYQLLPSSLRSTYIGKKNGVTVCGPAGWEHYFGPYRFGSRYEENKIFGAKPFHFLSELAGTLFDPAWKQDGFVKESRSPSKALTDLGALTDIRITSEKCPSPLTVKAGTFSDCIKITIQADRVLKSKDNYYFDNNFQCVDCGEKIFWYAPDVGIIRHDCIWGTALSSSTELTEYFTLSNTNDYMPVGVGNRWVYDEQTLEPGYTVRVTYEIPASDPYCVDNCDRLLCISEQDFHYNGTEEEYEEMKKR